MFEDSSYEPLAEIYFTLSGQPSIDNIYCLCSRVFVDGANEKEEFGRELVTEDEAAVEVLTSSNFVESSVRFCNSSNDLHQPLLTNKKSHEEAVSCYCSASHYSTDEHDSLRDVSHHSDSGADLSQSSQDLDWERYWTLNGERLIWQSWISKYGSYIDPNYLCTNASVEDNITQEPAQGEEASFCVENEKFPDPNRKTSFLGLLDNIKSESECRRSSIQEENPAEICAPQILIECVKNIDEVFIRRLSDFSDTGKSVSGKSEDSLNCEDNERVQLGVDSRCSGSSAILSATTDSMTNITRLTQSSSDSSCGIDDNSSAKSNSAFSSSDSASSADQQWQHLWAEHFNQQYYFYYSKFIERINKKKDGDEVKSDSGFIIDDSKASSNQPSVPQRQESVDEVGSIETQDSNSLESDYSKPSATESSDSTYNNCNLSKKKASNKIKLSVGYLLQQLKAMSVETAENIQEEDESKISALRPTTVINDGANENVTNNASKDNKKGEYQDTIIGKIENQTNQTVDEGVNSFLVNMDSDQAENGTNVNNYIISKSSSVVDESNNDPVDGCTSICNEEIESAEDMALKINSDDDVDSITKHGTKRSHECENESSVEKIKHAYQLMGLMYNLKETKKICKASVWYKKRFSQIRFQNRILNMQKPINKHTYFHEDQELPDIPATKSENPLINESKETNDFGEHFEDASEVAAPMPQVERGKLENEEFSEKDDSTDDDQDIFFSAEEDNFNGSQDRKLKSLPKRRKKRQLKKKYVCYPGEMVAMPKLKKYWRKRYSLFSKYDEGIRMDAESWYSVTPEKIAMNIAERCQCDLVVDAFCGAGGNAIQLAFTCEQVIAIDIDPQKIEMARHNACVYGVEDRIEFLVADYLQVASTLVADAVFLSPPWGGPGYTRQSVFPLASLLPVTGQELYKVTSAITDNIAFYLPKNINTQELVECAGPGGSVEVVQNFLDRELVALTAYFGELVNPIE